MVSLVFHHHPCGLASCEPLTFMLKPLTSPAEGAGNDSVRSCVEEEVVA